MYDVTNLQSFENLEDWYQTVMKYCASRKPLFALVGNKCPLIFLKLPWLDRLLLGDLEHLRAVKSDKHQRFAKDHDTLSYFVSAKTGESVENLFRQVTAHLMHIVLPKNDYEATRIITAPIIRQESSSPAPVQSLPPTGQTRTSICSLQ